MDFNFFERLNPEEAKRFLHNYLTEEKKGFEKLSSDLISSGIMLDYSFNSLLPVFEWVIHRIHTIPTKKDENLPSWITETESYKKGLYSFDEFSKILVMRTSFYLGECFVNNSKKLVWKVGRIKTAEQNMPVISGFQKKLELSVILVSENLIRRILEGGDLSIIEACINKWKSFIP